jgi:hypothetical protein
MARNSHQDFHFHLRQQMYLLKQPILPSVKGDFFNLQAENTTDFNSTSTDDVDRQSVNNDNSATFAELWSIFMDNKYICQGFLNTYYTYILNKFCV